MLDPHVYDQTIRKLLFTLPPPPDGGTDDYVQLAIEQMAALAPANAAEASIAVQYIACTAQAAVCLRMSQATDPKTARSLAAQGASMMRLGRDFRTQLMRVQAIRIKRDADPVARAQAAAESEAVQRGLQQAVAEVTASGWQRDVPVPWLQERPRAGRRREAS